MNTIVKYFAAWVMMGNFGGGIIHGLSIVFDSRGMISLVCLGHFVIFLGLVVFWHKKICPYYFETSRAPLYIVLVTWYISMPLFVFQTTTLEHLGYGYATYSFYTDAPMVYVLMISSFLVIWYWDELKYRIPYEFRSCQSIDDKI